MSTSKYPGPCCGYLVFSQSPGSYSYCLICAWEDDIVQLRFPTVTGANRVSLIEAQKKFARDGVCNLRLRSYVRPPQKSDLRDPNWHPIDESVDNIEKHISGIDYGKTYLDDWTQYYYWRH